MTTPLRSLHLAGLKITPLSLDDAVASFLADARARRPRVYIFVNGYSAELRRKNPAYASALEDELSIGVIDGAALELAGRLRGERGLHRCPGPDFFTAVAEASIDGGDVPFFLLGGNEGVAQQAADALSAQSPGLAVAGTLCPQFGFWDDQLSSRLVAAVHDSHARALWLGISAPKQEIWAVAHAEELGMPIACVGAAFDFIAGNKPRAPKVVRMIRLEWLFRLVTEPQRLWRRYLVGNAIFIFDAIRFGDRPAT